MPIVSFDEDVRMVTAGTSKNRLHRNQQKTSQIVSLLSGSNHSFDTLGGPAYSAGFSASSAISNVRLVPPADIDRVLTNFDFLHASRRSARSRCASRCRRHPSNMNRLRRAATGDAVQVSARAACNARQHRRGTYAADRVVQRLPPPPKQYEPPSKGRYRRRR